MRRPASDRSPAILAHEMDRAHRLAGFWEREIDTLPRRFGAPTIAGLLLAALEFAEAYDMADFRSGRPALAAHLAAVGGRPSMTATRPELG